MLLTMIYAIPIIVVGLILLTIRVMWSAGGGRSSGDFDAWFRAEYMGMDSATTTATEGTRVARPEVGCMQGSQEEHAHEPEHQLLGDPRSRCRAPPKARRTHAAQDRVRWPARWLDALLQRIRPYACGYKAHDWRQPLAAIVATTALIVVSAIVNCAFLNLATLFNSQGLVTITSSKTPLLGV